MYLCSLWESNIFGVRAIFSTDACHVFPQCVLALIPLTGGVIVIVLTTVWTRHWRGSLLCSVLVNSPASNGVCSLVIGVETPRSVSELWHEKGETDVLTLAEEPLNIPLLGFSTGKHAMCCFLSPSVQVHKAHFCWHCPQPRLNHGNAGSCLVFPSGVVLYSQSCQHRSVVADLLKWSTGTSVVTYLDPCGNSSISSDPDPACLPGLMQQIL